jgi:hypothetical protein
MVRAFLKVCMELGSYFLFLEEQLKDIIITFEQINLPTRGRKRTAYFAPVRTKYACFGTRFQRSDSSNSGIHLLYVTTVFKSRSS